MSKKFFKEENLFNEHLLKISATRSRNEYITSTNRTKAESPNQSSTRIKCKRRPVIIIIVCLTLLYVFCAFTLNNPQTTSYPDTKFILHWNDFLQNDDFNSEGYDLFEHCEHKNCYTTNDRTLVPVEEFSAILFEIPSSKYADDISPPKTRKPNQRYVFVNNETPIQFLGETVKYDYNSFFNWTMTYRFDSDVPRRQGIVVKKREYRIPNLEEVKRKSGSVAWFASNCNTTNKREVLVSQLKKHLDVDVFGNCGDLKCPQSKDCADVIESYWFYLSYENSYCKDYTTEKLYDALKLNVVPIVYGGGNYTKVAPPLSVINVEDFRSMKQLAKYLKYLQRNPDQYLKYFRWKKRYALDVSNHRTVCTLCKKLNDPFEPYKVYENIYEWWFSEDQSKCRSGDGLPFIIKQYLKHN